MFYSNPMHLEMIVGSEYERVTAAEPLRNGHAVLYFREKEKIKRETVPFSPFLLAEDISLPENFPKDSEIIELEQGAALSRVIAFKDDASYEKAFKSLRESTGKTPSAPRAPYRTFFRKTTQLMIKNRFRLFRGMKFNDIKRMQFDIETLTAEGYDFPNPERDSDSIVIITMSDNTGWEQCLSADSLSESELIEKFFQIVRERDPDVLEGHNIFRFDLPYIETRAKKYKIKPLIGRDGSPMTKRSSRLTVAERTVNYTRYSAFGRHFIDTLHLVQLYDVTHRSLESYSLKDVAKHFGVAPENRTYVDGRDISRLWHENRRELLEYAMDDVRETKGISDILSPSYFYQAQLIPMTYQDMPVRGNASKIDSMLTAEYINRRASIPAPEKTRPFGGALTKAFKSGIFENVWHCDIRSLYPSIILSDKLVPSRDRLGIFTSFLDKLRTFRLEAKDSEKNAKKRAEKDYFNSIQTTFKILINSFYGYLGSSTGTFNDFDMAEKVTARGREILTLMLDFLQENNAEVIEMDTDGIYFQPPPGQNSPVEMEKKIQAVLPNGIEVELDSVYSSMFCYKSKNYALLHDNGEVSVTGAALKSRGLEPFQRAYIADVIHLLLHAETEKFEKLSRNYREKINSAGFPLRDMAKTETLSSSIEMYRKKLQSGKGRRSAAYELAANSERNYQRGDQIAYYVTGDKKTVSVVDNSKLLSDAAGERDENIKYYLGKFEELYKKFSVFFPKKNTDELDLEFE